MVAIAKFTKRKNLFYQFFDFERLPGVQSQEDYRTEFQVDRDRVIFSSTFRQLQSKTQVFRSGDYDFYRTRLTHSIEVARIGHSICDYLNVTSPVLSEEFFIDADLVEALGFAHDLGHPAFGHIGERKLNHLMQEFGGFEGNAQTLRILTELIYSRDGMPQGMSPTRAFLDGVLKYKVLHSEHIQFNQQRNSQFLYPHNHFLYDEQEPIRNFVLHSPETVAELKSSHPSPYQFNQLKSIECQIMDWADDTAYSMHDILDGVQAEFLNITNIQEWASLQTNLTPHQFIILEKLLDSISKGIIQARFSKQIGQFIRATSISENNPSESTLSHLTNRYKYKLEVEKHIFEECNLYQRIANDLIFESPHMQQLEFKGGFILERLFKEFFKEYVSKKNTSILKILPQNVAYLVQQEKSDRAKTRRICDYLAGLTDGLAIKLYKRLYDPDFGSITDLV